MDVVKGNAHVLVRGTAFQLSDAYASADFRDQWIAGRLPASPFRRRTRAFSSWEHDPAPSN